MKTVITTGRGVYRCTRYFDTVWIETIERPNDPTLRVCQPPYEGSTLEFLDDK